MSLINMTFYSKYLCGSTDINVILPDLPFGEDPSAFYTAGKKYPVVFLLHGLSGGCSDWCRQTSVERYLSERRVAAVMPSAMSSEYANWPSVMSRGYDFFDYFVKELMPMVHSWFPVSSDPKDNYIAGLSMGGGGALKIAASNPELFGGVACMSSCAWDFSCLQPYARMTAEQFSALMTSPEKMAWLTDAGIPAPFLNSLIKYPTIGDFLGSYENVRERIADAVASGKMPRTYNCIGTLDDGYSKFLDYKKYCENLGADMAFEIYENYGHVWALWDLTVQRALDYFGL